MTDVRPHDGTVGDMGREIKELREAVAQLQIQSVVVTDNRNGCYTLLQHHANVTQSPQVYSLQVYSFVESRQAEPFIVNVGIFRRHR